MDSTTVLHWSTMKDSGGTFRRWIDFIQQFDFMVMHRAGKTTINADLISRATHMDDPPPLMQTLLHKVIRKYTPCLGKNYA